MSDSTNANIPQPAAPFLVGRPEPISPVWWAFLLSMFNRTGGNIPIPPPDVTLEDVFGLETLNPSALAFIGMDTASGFAREHEYAPRQTPGANDSISEMFFAPLNATDASAAQAPHVIAPSASPFTYTATVRQALHVVGGTVSSATYARGATSLALGVVSAGQFFELNTGDTVTLVYSVTPTITLLPR